MEKQTPEQEAGLWLMEISSLQLVKVCVSGRSSTSYVTLDAFVYCVLFALCNILSIIQNGMFSEYSAITQDALKSSSTTLKRTDLAADWLSGDVIAHLALSQAQMLFRWLLWLL